jgi:hypothetical protein
MKSILIYCVIVGLSISIYSCGADTASGSKPARTAIQVLNATSQSVNGKKVTVMGQAVYCKVQNGVASFTCFEGGQAQSSGTNANDIFVVTDAASLPTEGAYVEVVGTYTSVGIMSKIDAESVIDVMAATLGK